MAVANKSQHSSPVAGMVPAPAYPLLVPLLFVPPRRTIGRKPVDRETLLVWSALLGIAGGALVFLLSPFP